jgi:hypothetical protein
VEARLLKVEARLLTPLWSPLLPKSSSVRLSSEILPQRPHFGCGEVFNLGGFKDWAENGGEIEK